MSGLLDIKNTIYLKVSDEVKVSKRISLRKQVNNLWKEANILQKTI